MLWKMNEEVSLEHVLTGKLLWSGWTVVKSSLQQEVYAKPPDDNVLQRVRSLNDKHPYSFIHSSFSVNNNNMFCFCFTVACGGDEARLMTTPRSS